MKLIKKEMFLMVGSKIEAHQGNMKNCYHWLKKTTNEDEWAIDLYYHLIEREMANLLYWYGIKDLCTEYFELIGEDNE